MSETLHRSDEVTTAKQASIYNGCQFSIDEIRIARVRLMTQVGALEAAGYKLGEQFDKRDQVEIKLAAERLDTLAADVARTSLQIKALAASLALTFRTHLNRRARVA